MKYLIYNSSHANKQACLQELMALQEQAFLAVILASQAQSSELMQEQAFLAVILAANFSSLKASKQPSKATEQNNQATKEPSNQATVRASEQAKGETVKHTNKEVAGLISISQCVAFNYFLFPL